MKLITSLNIFTALAFLACSTDLPAQINNTPPAQKKIPMPDIAGEWLSDSPLDYFVNDDSRQPVNKFRIEKSDEADFVARYIGNRATGVHLKWSDENQHFEGTMSNHGETTFVVKLTSDPDVLKCKIVSDQLLNAKSYYHDDQWKRSRGKSATPKSTKTSDPSSSETKDSSKPGSKEDQNQTTVVQYEDSPVLTPKIKADTEKLLISYVDYLKSLGFELQRGQVVLRLQEGMGNAHYYQTNRSIVMDSRVVTDKSVIRREYNHHALATALGDNSREIFEKCSGIESALADYLGCSQCDDPEVGHIFVTALYEGRTEQPFLRTMDNLRSFTEIEDASGRHNIGEVMSGALWEMRGAIGKEHFDPLLYKAWVGLVKTDASSGQVQRFAHSLLEVARSQNPEASNQIQAIFERRGLKITE